MRALLAALLLFVTGLEPIQIYLEEQNKYEKKWLLFYYDLIADKELRYQYTKWYRWKLAPVSRLTKINGAVKLCFMCDSHQQSGTGRRPYFCSGCKQILVDHAKVGLFNAVKAYARSTIEMLEAYEKDLFPERHPNYRVFIREGKTEMEYFAQQVERWDLTAFKTYSNRVETSL